MIYTLRFFFSSKCSLFHNSKIFGSCIIHILYTGVLKLKKIILEEVTEKRGRTRKQLLEDLNTLTPNDPYSGRTTANL